LPASVDATKNQALILKHKKMKKCTSIFHPNGYTPAAAKNPYYCIPACHKM